MRKRILSRIDTGFWRSAAPLPLDLGLFGPVARSRRALYLRRAAGGCFGVCWRWRWYAALVCVRWPAGAGLPVCWPAGAGLLVCWPLVCGAIVLRLFVSARMTVFSTPTSLIGPGADPGGIARTLRLQLPALRIYIPRRADSVDCRTQKKFVTK